MFSGHSHTKILHPCDHGPGRGLVFRNCSTSQLDVQMCQGLRGFFSPQVSLFSWKLHFSLLFPELYLFLSQTQCQEIEDTERMAVT